MSDLRKEIQRAINRCSAENGSNTPDFLLADFLVGCLAAFDQTVTAREKWYGRDPARGPASCADPPSPTTREALASLLRPVRDEHGSHTAHVEGCPFCEGAIT